MSAAQLVATSGLLAVVPGEPHTIDGEAQKSLRHNAVDVLAVDGVVMNKRVERVLHEVPRHRFAPKFSIRRGDGGYDEHVQTGGGVDGYDARVAAQQLLYSPGARPVISFADDGTPNVVMDTMRDVAGLLELAQVEENRSVLEIGTGTGYTTALLRLLTGHASKVTSIDCAPFAVSMARRHFPSDGPGMPRILHDDGVLGDNSAAPFGVVVSWCDVPRVPAAWVRQCSMRGRVVTTVAGQRIALLRNEEFATDFTVSGRFSAGVEALGVSPLFKDGRAGSPLAPALASLSDLADRGGWLTVTFVPMGSLEHPTLRWLLTLVHPELVFEVYEDFYRVLDPYSQSWVNAYPALGSKARIKAGGTRRSLWEEVMQVHTMWTRYGRPERSEFGLTVAESGEHLLWLGEPSNVLMPLKSARQ